MRWPADVQDLEESYRGILVKRFVNLPVPHVQKLGKAIRVPLEGVYVELNAVADVPEAADTFSANERRLLAEAEARGRRGDRHVRMQLDSLRAERWRREDRDGHARLRRRSIEEAIAAPDRPTLVILGDPGSGKSTLLAYLALRTARERLPDPASRARHHPAWLRLADGTPRLPIFVPLAAYDVWLKTDGVLPLRDFLPVYHKRWQDAKDDLGPLFEQALHQGRALVLLDGLDEVRDPSTRTFVTEQVQALLREEEQRGNRFVITSRIVGYREAPLEGDLPHVTLLEFGMTEIALFVRRWCQAYEIALAGERTDEALRRAATEEKALLALISERPSLQTLTASPLMLVMLASLRRENQRLPDHRAQLYEEYVTRLLKERDRKRSPGARTAPAESLDVNATLAILNELSLVLMQKPGRTASEREILGVLRDVIVRHGGLGPHGAALKEPGEAEAQARRFLKAMRESVGLLIERGTDAFGFLHLTFQEYFAGRALAAMQREDRWKFVEEILHHPRWREPILLCAGHIGIVKRAHEEVTDLGRRILEAESRYEDLLHRDLFLAGALAADDVGITPGLLDKIASKLIELIDERVPTVRHEALRGVAQLTRVGHEGARRVLEGRVGQRGRAMETARAVAPVLGAQSFKWLRQALCGWLDDPGDRVRQAAVFALSTVAATDADVLSSMIGKLNDSNEYVRKAVLECLRSTVQSDADLRHSLLGVLDSSTEEERRAIVKVLRPWVPSDAEVRRRILTKLNDSSWRVRRAVLLALRGMDLADDAVRRGILDAVDDPDESVQKIAIEMLSPLVTRDEEVRRRILDAIEDPKAWTRRAAVEALSPSVATDEEVGHRILGAIDDPDASVRITAVKTMRLSMAGDEEVRRRILGAIDDPDAWVRSAAAEALGPWVASDPEVYHHVLGKLVDPSAFARSAAAEALSPLVMGDEQVRRRILGVMSDPNASVRRAAVDALGPSVASDEAVRRHILNVIDDPDDLARMFAVYALGPLAASDEEVRRSILARVRDLDKDVREAAVAALRAVAADHAEVRRHLVDEPEHPLIAREMIHALRPLAAMDEETRRRLVDKLDDPNEWARLAAIEVLRSSDTSGGEVSRHVVRKLDDPEFMVQCAAASALGSMDVHDSEVRRHLLRALDNKYGNVRHAASNALRPLVASDPDVRRRFIGLLGDSDDLMWSDAVEALGPLASSDDEVRGHIFGMLEGADSSSRYAAIGALCSIVSDDEVRRRVLGALQDPDPSIRGAAVEALSPLVSDAEVRRRMVGALKGSHDEVTRAIVMVLGPWIASDAEVHRCTLGMLRDANPEVRRSVVEALSAAATTDANVRHHLFRALDDPDEGVRHAAAMALRPVLVSDGDARRNFLTKLEDPTSRARFEVVAALSPAVEDDPEVRRHFVRMLGDESSWLRHTAVEALTPLARSDPAVRLSMLDSIDDPEEWVQRAALDALCPLATDDADVRHRLLDKVDRSHVALAALAPLVASDVEVRRRVLDMLEAPNEDVRTKAVQALSPFVSSDTEVRRRVLARFQDPYGWVRRAAVEALGPLVAVDEEVRAHVLAKVEHMDAIAMEPALVALAPMVASSSAARHCILDALHTWWFDLRYRAVRLLIPFIAEDLDIRERLFRWLGVVTEHYAESPHELRIPLAEAYGLLAAREPKWLDRVISMLDSVAWPERAGAALTLLAMPGGPPAHLLPRLRDLLDDMRGEESLPDRIREAARRINDRDLEVSRRAIETIKEALGYATQPWYDLPGQGPPARAQAAEALGALEPVYRDEIVITCLCRVLREDVAAEALDAAYRALLRLVAAPEMEHDVKAWIDSLSVRRLQPSSAQSCLVTMPAPSPALVLHLSDLHFGTPEDADLWHSQLADDLHHNFHCKKLDAVIVSGDVANRATLAEYAAARRFLEKLSNRFRLSAQQVIVVPGNHDVSWTLAMDAYKTQAPEQEPPDLKTGHYYRDDKTGELCVRDDALYPRRFKAFSDFYQSIFSAPYPLEYSEQALLYHLPQANLLVLGLNSAWELDHHFRERPSIHPLALSNALDRLHLEPAYEDCLKIAVWHHPIHSALNDRIKEHGFLERLANAGFQLALHGHIHAAQNSVFRHEMSSTGLEIVCAGTFGAPVREWVPGYPLQYQVLRFEATTLTVETRRREQVNGAWKPDARWGTERGKDPVPRYTIALTTVGSRV